MKKSILLLAVMAAVLCLSSCKKEENGKVLFKATIENPAQQSKTSIASNGMMTWRSGDRIVVFYGTSATSMTGQSLLSTTSTGRTAEFTLALGNEPTGGHYYAVYPASIAGMIYHNTINLPAAQEYHAAESGKVQFEAPMYAYSNDDQLVFKNLCGVVRITLTSPKTINRIAISANEPLCGQFTVSWNGGEPSLATTSTEGTEVEFTCGSGVDCTEGTDFYLYLPVNEVGYTGMEFAFYATDGTYSTKTLKDDQRYVVGRNTLNPLVFNNLVFRPVGAIGGLFSVSATQQVYFSQGNLQYQASTNTWRFAEHQWDYVGAQTTYGYGYNEGVCGGGTVNGSDNCSISITYSGWIDLFGWGTSGWNSGAVCYQPWSNSTKNTDYCPGGSFAYGLTGNYAEADWAWHNAISNGGNSSHLWRTLTNDEWNYVFNTRSTSSGIRYAKATVGGIGGFILLPDNWDASYYTLSSTNNGYAAYISNNITTTTWINNLERYGAVFLPITGFRLGSVVYNVGWDGCYWSSTPYYYGSNYVLFNGSGLNAMANTQRQYSRAVRPVRENS